MSYNHLQKPRRGDRKIPATPSGLLFSTVHARVPLAPRSLHTETLTDVFHLLQTFGGIGLPNGLIMLPIIAGIAMLFLMDRKIFGWVVLSIGIVVVLLSVMLTTHLRWRTTNAYVFIVMFGMVAAGGGMVLRELFRKD